jgi:hypothetical protein
MFRARACSMQPARRPQLCCLAGGTKQADIPGVISDIYDFTAEAAHFATLVRALCGRPETSRRPGHTIGMEREHPVDSRSAKTALVLREGARKNHYTESFKLQATTRRFSVSRPFQPQPLPRAGRGTLLNSKGTTYNPQVAPENASFRVRAHEKTITQMTVYRIFTPGISARHLLHEATHRQGTDYGLRRLTAGWTQ